ncbi:MAG: hypothetical protein AUH85_16965 [Chloroflexi bacterium 13_1_40CM_4_68_4]|nr:MAG: hypothetical protein AUH85_16965 [Chloroflexi bacterium 13_1_40CM_4_68_4]
MRRLLGLIALVIVALTLAAGTVLAAPTAVATKLQLRGHLPDLGETPAMWVFTTAVSYDSFRVQYDIADVFPDSDSLYMSFDKEILALYTRGNDTGGRCLRAGPVSGVVATTVVLDLSWDASSCGAPASAHYPFVLASLSRTADDGSTWISGRQVCAAAPGIDGSRACAPASGAAASPTPSATTRPSPTATATASPSLSPSSTATLPPTQTASSTPTHTASASPTIARTSSPSPSPTAVVAGTSSAGGSGLLDIAGWLAVGLIIGVFVTALVMRPRVYRV